ncbi:MAG: hypothetical protein MUE53_05895 [Chitinophagales bacterium]|jgi:hypothetical protein|nr:hypothetical protein [Chitinophagales bacterium]
MMKPLVFLFYFVLLASSLSLQANDSTVVENASVYIAEASSVYIADEASIESPQEILIAHSNEKTTSVRASEVAQTIAAIQEDQKEVPSEFITEHTTKSPNILDAAKTAQKITQSSAHLNQTAELKSASHKYQNMPLSDDKAMILNYLSDNFPNVQKKYTSAIQPKEFNVLEARYSLCLIPSHSLSPIIALYEYRLSTINHRGPPNA